MATLSPQDIKTLEQTRQRLDQLARSLSNLQSQIATSDPLPPWPTLHSLTQILAQNLTSLSTQMQTNSPLLASTAIYPVPLYPGREKEGILNQLLRKKLEPGVEEWVEQGQKIAEEVVGDDAAEWKDLWEWAAVNGNELARSHDWGGDDEDEDEDEDEDDSGKGGVKMEGVEKNGKKIDVKPMDMHDVLQFLSKGQDSKG